MNFDTKYLIRWGIPGWIMVMALLPYFFVTYFKVIQKLPYLSASDILAIGAVLTVLGVPLGYMLGQVHHALFWVVLKIPNKGWTNYFKEEIKADKFLKRDSFERERYRYLLSKKHELGGVTVSLGISTIIIFITNIWFSNGYTWSWIYFCVIAFLTLIIIISRAYSSANVRFYFNEHLLRNEESNIVEQENESTPD